MIVHLRLDPDTYKEAIEALGRWWAPPEGMLLVREKPDNPCSPYRYIVRVVKSFRGWRYLSRKAVGLC